jgi:YtkA-like
LRAASFRIVQSSVQRIGGWRLLVAYAALVATLFLGTSCSKQTAGQSAVATSSEVSGPLRLQLSVSPTHPSMIKPLTLLLHVTDEQGQLVNDAQVSGALSMKTMDMGATQLKFAAKGNGDYEATTNIDMSGPWTLAIDAAQGSVHVKKSFVVTVSD